MSTLEDIFVSAKSIFSKAGKKAEKIVGVSRLRISGAEIKRQISQALEELGIITYESSKNQPHSDSEVKLLVAKIDELKRQEKKLRKKISSIKNKVECLHCYYENDSDSIFCAQCGKKIEKNDNDFKPKNNQNAREPEKKSQEI